MRRGSSLDPVDLAAAAADQAKKNATESNGAQGEDGGPVDVLHWVLGQLGEDIELYQPIRQVEHATERGDQAAEADHQPADCVGGPGDPPEQSGDDADDR